MEQQKGTDEVVPNENRRGERVRAILQNIVVKLAAGDPVFANTIGRWGPDDLKLNISGSNNARLRVMNFAVLQHLEELLGMDWKRLGFHEVDGHRFNQQVVSADGQFYYNKPSFEYFHDLDDCELLLRLVQRELEARAREREKGTRP
jgi:hypothetical protein